MVSEYRQTVRIFYRLMDQKNFSEMAQRPSQKTFTVSLIFKFGRPDYIRDVSG